MTDTDRTFTVKLPADNPYGGEYTLNLNDLSGLDEIDIRNTVGHTFVGLSEAAQKDTGLGLVLVATIVWLVRRRDFAHTTFEQVASTIKYGTEVELVDGDEKDEGKEPATGTDS